MHKISYDLFTHILFWIASQALGQSYDCPSACEVTLKDTGNRPVPNHNVNRQTASILHRHSDELWWTADATYGDDESTNVWLSIPVDQVAQMGNYILWQKYENIQLWTW